jgi:transglycosylase-like protein/LysM domain-containing protein
MSRGRHAKPSSLPSASTLAAAAPAVLVVAAAAPSTGHQAAPAASAPGTAAPAASAGLSPSGTVRALRMQAARASAHPSWVMATVHVRSGDSLSTLARRYYHHAAWWPRIWWANRHQVANPNEIRPGEAFIIPVPRAPRPSAVVDALHAIPPAPVTSSGTAGTGGMSAFQACVIAAESGGNPTAVNPSSGAGGLYQFLPSTWQALGHSGLPENASVAEQNQAFQQEYAQSGTAAWAPYDGC